MVRFASNRYSYHFPRQPSIRFLLNLGIHHLHCLLPFLDGPCEAKVCRSHPKLPNGGTAVSPEVQTTLGTSIQDRYVLLAGFYCKSWDWIFGSFPVKPDASPDEIKAVVDDDQGGQIFSQAVRRCSSWKDVHSNLWWHLVDEHEPVWRSAFSLPGSARATWRH